MTCSNKMSPQMAKCSSDHEGEVPVIPTEAEITLKKLLDKQLCTSGRLEQVEFQEATESMHCIGHGSSGVASLLEFKKNELVQKQWVEKARCLRTVLHAKGYSKDEIEERCRKTSCIDDIASTIEDKGVKRKRYGANPLFVSHEEWEELDIAAMQNKYTLQEQRKTNKSGEGFGRHAKELEASLLRGKDRLQAIAHLSAGVSACRKPLISSLEQTEIYIGMTPKDRARLNAEQEASRPADEVFNKRAPEVLDLHTYLDQRPYFAMSGSPIATSLSEATKGNFVQNGPLPSSSQMEEGNSEWGRVEEIPEQDIICNRLSQQEIRELPGGKFANYSPGNPSNILYVKNLSEDVSEADLVALFLRYQVPKQKLIFRLMRRGRMKGQAFITFSDASTSLKALQLINGYKLKGRPMVIEFGRVHPHA